MKTVLHLTTVHSRNDTRIFFKEAQAAAKGLPHNVVLMVADGSGNINRELGYVSIRDLGRLERGRFFRIIAGSVRAFNAIQQIRPSLVHFHDPELIPLALVLKALGYKVIYDVHEDVPRQTMIKHYLPRMLRKQLPGFISTVEWLGGKVFDAIVPATPKIAERFPTDKTVIVQNFPIADELRPSSPVPYAGRPPSFVYIGGIAKIRGAEEMLRAIDLLGDVSGARLDLAGSFSPADFEKSLKLLPGWRAVNYVGYASRAQIQGLLNNTRAGLVTLHPTENYLDSYPVKMFEYMSVGLPVIASDFPLWRRIIEKARCGLLVDPLNPTEIAGAMRWILEHPNEAEAMGKRGRDAIETDYNWYSEALEMLNLYNNLLAS